MRASCPVAFLAGLILPYQERTGWAMSEIRPAPSLIATAIGRRRTGY